MEQPLNERIENIFAKRGKKFTKRAATANNLVYALLGPPRPPYPANGDFDLHDFHRVMYLRWADVRGDTLVNATPSPEDRALIAAAPDLLEALQGLVTAIDDIRHDLGTSYPALSELWGQRWGRGIAAIAKAEGRGA